MVGTRTPRNPIFVEIEPSNFPGLPFWTLFLPEAAKMTPQNHEKKKHEIGGFPYRGYSILDFPNKKPLIMSLRTS